MVVSMAFSAFGNGGRWWERTLGRVPRRSCRLLMGKVDYALVSVFVFVFFFLGAVET